MLNESEIQDFIPKVKKLHKEICDPLYDFWKDEDWYRMSRDMLLYRNNLKVVLGGNNVSPRL